jgi:hypothetical protein
MWNLKLIALIATPILLVGSAWFGHSRGTQYGMSVVQSQWDAERMATQAAQAEELMKARQTEQALQALVNRTRQEKTREATRLANDYAAVINSLHDRAARPDPGGVPEAAGTGDAPSGCTGAQLYREDAAVLAGLARDADQLRLALKQCQAVYTEVRSRQ